jgi:hypothetical protein
VACWQQDEAPVDIAITDARGIAVAATDACALRATGAISCWSHDAPAPVATKTTTAIAIAGRSRELDHGGNVFAAVLADHAVTTWGFEGAAPAIPKLPADLTRVSVGRSELCVLGAAVTCWGTGAARTVAAGARDVSVGGRIGCAATADGHVQCWGDMMDGHVAIPVDVPGVGDAAQIAVADETTCARRTNGHVVCWGTKLADDWNNGERGLDLDPHEVAGITDATDLAVSVRNACVRRANGRVSCWGAADERGKQIETIQKVPTDVPAYANPTWLGDYNGGICVLRGGRLVCRLQDVKTLAAYTTRVWEGGHFRTAWTCGRTQAGIACQEEYSKRDDYSLTATTMDLDWSNVVDVQLPVHQLTERMCVVRAAGAVECRDGGAGPLHPIAGVTDAIALTTGPRFDTTTICALRKSGGVICWDRDDAAAPIPTITDAVELAGGEWNACVRRKSGQVTCWGAADYLGRGKHASPDAPVTIPGVAL